MHHFVIEIVKQKVCIPWLSICCLVGVFVFVFVFVTSAEIDEVSKHTVVLVFLVSETTTFYQKLKIINVSIFCIFSDFQTEIISFVEFQSSKENWFCLLVSFFLLCMKLLSRVLIRNSTSSSKYFPRKYWSPWLADEEDFYIFTRWNTIIIFTTRNLWYI